MLIWPAEELARAKLPHAVTHTACHYSFEIKIMPLMKDKLTLIEPMSPNPLTFFLLL